MRQARRELEFESAGGGSDSDWPRLIPMRLARPVILDRAVRLLMWRKRAAFLEYLSS
jgi:hypothetical protein